MEPYTDLNPRKMAAVAPGATAATKSPGLIHEAVRHGKDMLACVEAARQIGAVRLAVGTALYVARIRQADREAGMSPGGHGSHSGPRMRRGSRNIRTGKRMQRDQYGREYE